MSEDEDDFGAEEEEVVVVKSEITSYPQVKSEFSSGAVSFGAGGGETKQQQQQQWTSRPDLVVARLFDESIKAVDMQDLTSLASTNVHKHSRYADLFLSPHVKVKQQQLQEQQQQQQQDGLTRRKGTKRKNPYLAPLYQPNPDDWADTNRTFPEVSNIVALFSLSCSVRFDMLPVLITNCEFNTRKRNGVQIRLRHPACTVTVHSQDGRARLTGARSEQDAYTAARRVARKFQKAGIDVSLKHFRIAVVFATADTGIELPSLEDFARQYEDQVFYDEERGQYTFTPEEQPQRTGKTFTLAVHKSGKIIFLGGTSRGVINRAYREVYKKIVEHCKRSGRQTTTSSSSASSIASSSSFQNSSSGTQFPQRPQAGI
eukprot:CAMPEP_0175100664 /NCGR_PEP_ID=MMETSP0086_2-20121207/7265_1 /TAXON_ID=136419 /ORGANISM="Unknown Unknown, Strain D1" /LENGTH=372 /DNA_ID=CAMNT_0016374905 /DNA_START=29 /DNA_END=1147 /DNA_ORIENTATION=+